MAMMTNWKWKKKTQQRNNLNRVYLQISSMRWLSLHIEVTVVKIILLLPFQIKDLGKSITKLILNLKLTLQKRYKMKMKMCNLSQDSTMRVFGWFHFSSQLQCKNKFLSQLKILLVFKELYQIQTHLILNPNLKQIKESLTLTDNLQRFRIKA